MPEQMRWPIESAHTCPVRSISTAALMAHTFGVFLDQRGVVRAVAGMEFDQLVGVEEVVTALAAGDEARARPTRMHRLSAVRDHTVLDQRDQPVGEHYPCARR